MKTIFKVVVGSGIDSSHLFFSENGDYSYLDGLDLDSEMADQSLVGELYDLMFNTAKNGSGQIVDLRKMLFNARPKTAGGEEKLITLYCDKACESNGWGLSNSRGEKIFLFRRGILNGVRY